MPGSPPPPCAPLRPPAPSGPIRQPVATDKYYPASAADLQRELDGCLASPAPAVIGPHLAARWLGQGGGMQAAATPAGTAGRRLRGLIVPHGSVQDSGRVAAAAYALLASELAAAGDGTSGASCHLSAPQPATSALAPSEAATSAPTRLLMLGTDHFTDCLLACLSTAAAWATPLGQVPVDPELTPSLAAAGVPYDDTPHNLEHSLENQLPFLQHTLTGAGAAAGASGRQQPGFAIAPVCVGWLGGMEAVEKLAGQVTAALEQAPALLLATSDFTHAGPSYREQVAAPWMTLREHCIWRDSPLLHAICRGSATGFLDACETTGTSLCGRWPVAVLMRVAELTAVLVRKAGVSLTAQELGWSLELLSYAPSDLYVASGNINGFAAFAAWG